jgi:IstB-like ATP binding protein
MSVPETSARSSQPRVALPSRSKLALKSRAVTTGSQYTGKRRLIRVLMVAGEYLNSRPVLDELDYLPIDKHGADLLFQDVAARYEVGSIVITTNRPFREWGTIFDVDNTMAMALIDRLMHHGEGIVISGDSHCMRDKDLDSTDK